MKNYVLTVVTREVFQTEARAKNHREALKQAYDMEYSSSNNLQSEQTEVIVERRKADGTLVRCC